MSKLMTDSKNTSQLAAGALLTVHKTSWPPKNDELLPLNPMVTEKMFAVEAGPANDSGVAACYILAHFITPSKQIPCLWTEAIEVMLAKGVMLPKTLEATIG